ncbi:MAG: hypothetical protein E6K71_05855 [Candidatus Eisenbacteria bacterium]|uniref:Uncharacterized protein n=1 Tax=Eiseniibacteriota bacterium TaxID=2212470 RepID=A0A538SCL7_UNCEI|nr:MAG: hypothetical protein E6K71_05855 [Candidatus Eisenbacteria bacterium]
MRSRVTLKVAPTSSSVRGHPSSVRPNRSRITFASRLLRVSSTSFTSSLSIENAAAWAGETTLVSSMKSPRFESSSSPMGRSSEIGSCAALSTLLILSTGSWSFSATSSGVGSRPNSCTSRRDVRTTLLIASIMCTGTRIVRAWSAMARVMA